MKYRTLRLLLALLALQFVGPIVVVIVGRRWLPRAKPLTLGVVSGTLLGALNGVLCKGCTFVWQGDTAPQWQYTVEMTVLSGLYGAFVAAVIGATVRRLSRERSGRPGASPAA
jgi:hypothetical protein